MTFKNNGCALGTLQFSDLYQLFWNIFVASTAETSATYIIE